MPQIYDRIIKTISKPTNQCTESEINKLLPWFRKKSKLFRKLKSVILQDILQNCDFVSKKADDVIILQGDQGKCFYIILRGKVTIYNLSKEDEKITKLSEADLKNDKQELDRSKLGNFVCNLVPGDPFGEVALLSTDSIRTATVIADEITDLMVVSKALYERSVKDVLTWEFQQKIAFICAHPLFWGWSHKYRHQLAMAVYKIVLSYDEILIRQREPVTCIYFVLTGQVGIFYNPRLHALQYPQFIPFMQSNLTTSTVSSIQQNSFYMIAGDTEVLLKLDTNLHTVISSERTELIVLEMKHFERLFVRHHVETVDCMRRQLDLKLCSRLSLLTDCQQKIPLLAYLHNRLKQDLEQPRKCSNLQEFRNTTFNFKLDISRLQTRHLLHKQPLANIFFLIQQKKFPKKIKTKVQKCLFPQIPINNQVFEKPSNDTLISGKKSSISTSLQDLEQCIRNWLKEANPQKIGTLPPLHRISLETLQKQPKPGYKLLVHQNIHLDLDLRDESSDNDEDEININSEKLEKWKFLLTNFSN
uniref:Cyclic nucleotide-binding domain-containing protein n=1 Tax=Octopus bimaculoides TaxID=37653 RepID=A0A0L8IEW7_OCTBM